ncbi:MAG TPA: adenylosuccinate synthetase, partial [Halanaerobiales bacterium]|nr:adenylosuccinate synthetase [Halanaerobiales bacterium]
PVYQKFEGWDEDISKVREYENLPENAKKYIEKIEDMVDTRISIIGIGPGREEAIIKN